MTAVKWFRRDLRLSDNPALVAACADGSDRAVRPLFVLDRRLWGPAGDSPRAHLSASLRARRLTASERSWAPGGDGDGTGYPGPIADQAAERREAIARWERMNGSG